jgi:hypothetical protein
MMIVMKSAFRLHIGLFFLLQCALPLVTDRETRTQIMGGGLSDRTAIAGAARRSRKRNVSGTDRQPAGERLR